MPSDQQADKFKREVEAFRIRTEEILAEGLRPFYDNFMRKLAVCQESMAELSRLGLSACLVLDCLWRSMVATEAAKSGAGREYKRPQYWLKLSRRAEEIADQFERLPIIALDSDAPDTNALISALRDWGKKLKKSPLTDTNRVVFYEIHTNGRPFVRPGYKRPATKGPGRKASTWDYDVSRLAWQFNYWLRRLHPQIPGKRDSLANVLYTFFELGHTENEAHTLTQRILYFEKEHADDLDEYKRAATEEVRFAQKWYGGIPSPSTRNPKSD